MSDSPVNAVGRVDLDATTAALHMVGGSDVAAASLKAAGKTRADDQPAVEQQPDNSGGEGSPLSLDTVRLRFNVDEKTREVTVLIFDRASNELIRTIPPSELKNFREGSLFQLYT